MKVTPNALRVAVSDALKEWHLSGIFVPEEYDELKSALSSLDDILSHQSLILLLGFLKLGDIALCDIPQVESSKALADFCIDADNAKVIKELTGQLVQDIENQAKARLSEEQVLELQRLVVRRTRSSSGFYGYPQIEDPTSHYIVRLDACIEQLGIQQMKGYSYTR